MRDQICQKVSYPDRAGRDAPQLPVEGEFMDLERHKISQFRDIRYYGLTRFSNVNTRWRYVLTSTLPRTQQQQTVPIDFLRNFN